MTLERRNNAISDKEINGVVLCEVKFLEQIVEQLGFVLIKIVIGYDGVELESLVSVQYLFVCFRSTFWLYVLFGGDFSWN